MNKKDEDTTGSDCPSSALLSRLDAKRGMYFFNWLIGEWLSDPCGLEHVSVKTIIEAYDKKNGSSIFSENAQDDSRDLSR